MTAREEMEKGEPKTEEIIDDSPIPEKPKAKVSNMEIPKAAPATPAPKVAEQKFKRVMIEEDSEDDDEETTST